MIQEWLEWGLNEINRCCLYKRQHLFISFLTHSCSFQWQSSKITLLTLDSFRRQVILRLEWPRMGSEWNKQVLSLLETAPVYFIPTPILFIPRSFLGHKKGSFSDVSGMTEWFRNDLNSVIPTSFHFDESFSHWLRLEWAWMGWNVVWMI